MSGEVLGSEPPMVDIDMSSVWEALMNACRKPAIDHTGKQAFIPLGRLLRILSPRNVERILSQRFTDETLMILVNEVYGANGEPRRLKIMATLILVNGLNFLLDFVNAKVEDSQLPLTVHRRGQQAILYDREKNEIESSKNWTWSYPEAEYFTMKQMQLCSLFCTIDEEEQFMDHFRLPADFVLPLVDSDPPVIRSGGYGKVTKVFIEPSHLWYRGSYPKPECFAIKAVQHSSIDHPSEADSLARRLVIKKLADREHLHQLLFSFRRADYYYLVFEWADGDLTDLWETMPSLYRPDVEEDAVWFYRQCAGIVRSLGSLHEQRSSYTATTVEERVHIALGGKYGRHSDIKPQNLLWFSDFQGDKKDHLVIADLGLTQFNTSQSKSHVSWAGVKGYTQTYKAPESEGSDGVGARYDIWSLGCVFLEHASVFLMRDNSCVRTFSDNRLEEDKEKDFTDTYTPIGSRGIRGEVKKTVTKMIQDLKDHELCAPSMSDFLDLISEGMLEPNQYDRHTAGMVLRALRDIQLRCDQDPRYACVSRHLPLKDRLKSIPDSRIPSRQSRILAGISGGQEGSRANFDSSQTDSTEDAGAADPEALRMLNELRHMSNDINLSPDILQLQIPKIRFDGDWMKTLPGDLSVTQISIPGTHNSHAIKSNVVVASNGNVNFAAHALYNPGIVSMYAEIYTTIATCQSFSMWDQLHFGVRCFDLRVRSWEKFDNEGGRWAFGLCHGSAKLKESLTQVLDGMADFLKKYPSETLLISIKWDEEKLEGSKSAPVTPDWNLRFGVSEIWDKHNWFKGAYWPKLHEVRGRAILLRRFWNPDNEPLGINFDKPSFFDNARSDGPEGKWKQMTDPSVGSKTIEERWKCARDMLIEAKEADFNDDVMYFASTCDVWLDMTELKKPKFWTPLYYSQQLYQPLLLFMNGEYRSQKKGRYGVVVTDFCNQTVSQLIFEQNFSR
ncbi:serine threonine kinase [Fusarium napiforme]|uniref:Serine threonine kinase n=1 Tax=Fusarium napiforme TaxID=42672 RepID=A0A8H5I9U0_9HYPO|nr:serine threonine kinase [Fusarium napiforme]